MTPEEFKKWRKEHNISQHRAGELLGYSKTMVYYFERGQHEIPKSVELGCYAIDAGFYEDSKTKTPAF